MPSAAVPPLPPAGRSPPFRSRAMSAPSPETIRSYLQLKEGQPYDPAAADRSLKALFGTGLFSDVVIDMQGSTLVVKVTENPIINRVAFEGNKKIDDDKLRDEVQSKPRQVFTRARAGRRRAHPHHLSPRRPLQRRRSSPRSSSSSRAASTSSSRSTKATSRASSASASSATSISATARCAARSAPARAPGTASCRRTTATTPTASTSTANCCASSTCRKGYADFRVVSAVAELAPNRDGFFITFTINEGERYKFGKVEVSTRFQGLDVDVLKGYLTMAKATGTTPTRSKRPLRRCRTPSARWATPSSTSAPTSGATRTT